MKLKRSVIAIGICAVIISALIGNQMMAKEPENLVINIPDPCKTGTLTVESESETLFEYAGEIEIINDGKDGKPISIMINIEDDGQKG